MFVGHDEVELGCPSRSHVLQQAKPALFVFLSAGQVRQYLFVAFQIHSQSRQDDRSIGLVAMANTEVDAIEVQNAPMGG